MKNTQKITRAMKLVAAARLRRAQQDILEMRPYAVKTLEVLSAVAARANWQIIVHRTDESPRRALVRLHAILGGT